MPAPDTTRWPARLAGGAWRWEIVKVAVSATLLALILRRFSWQELRAEFAQTSLPALVLPFAIIVASNVLGAAQWRWILRAAGIGLRFGVALRLYVAGLFLNNFMLGNVGGDVYKIYTVGRNAGEMGRAAGATIVDRLVGLSALCALASFAAVGEIGRDHIPSGQAVVVLTFALAIMAASAVVLHPGRGDAIQRFVARLPLGAWSGKLSRLLAHLGDYRRQSRLLNGAFALSLAIQGARVAAHFFVGQAMGWSLHASDFAKFCLVIPILGLVIALPISLGGWGVREWAGMALFAPLGHGGEEAVTLLALTATLTLVASLAGALSLVVGPATTRSAVA
jgi:uncharacterized protein (TIRG00374 family)